MIKIPVDIEDLRGDDALEAAAPSPVMSLEDRLADILADYGLDVPPRAIERLEEACYAESVALAVEFTHELANRLEGTAGAMALKRVLQGDYAPPARTLAARVGCSHTAIIKSERKIRQRLAGVSKVPNSEAS
jgi:hypothetical protein